MKIYQNMDRVIAALAVMPFVDRRSLGPIIGMSVRSASETLTALTRRGIAGHIQHGTTALGANRRFYLTERGISGLSDGLGLPLELLLRNSPLCGTFQAMLLRRIDCAALTYRLAADIAAAEGPVGVRWFRALPIDAAILLPDDRTVGIVRQGHAAGRTGFAKRLFRLREMSPMSAVLVLASDEVRMRHAMRLLADAPLPAMVALESDVATAGPYDPVWCLPRTGAAIDRGRMLDCIDGPGTVPDEIPPARTLAPLDLSGAMASAGQRDRILPALLTPSEKVTLDAVLDWPHVSQEDLSGILGVSPARISQVAGSLRERGLVQCPNPADLRLGLTDRALALIARRDRASLTAMRKRWSMSPVRPLQPYEPQTWSNITGTKARQLLRNIEHTTGVHRFLAGLAGQARSAGWDVVQLDPPARASRYFRHGETLCSVHPDAFGILRRGAAEWAFFLEWERRAVRPVTMAARLAPYLRYYAGPNPIDDHGTLPAVLIVFDDALAASRFLGVARAEMAEAGVSLPLLVSDSDSVEELGPLGPIWRTAAGCHPAYALPQLRPGKAGGEPVDAGFVLRGGAGA